VVVLIACWLMLAPGATGVLAGDGEVNINTAGVKELETLPFIGEARARAIIRSREAKGRFQSVDEVREIPDIGDATFQAIRPYLTLSGVSAPIAKPDTPLLKVIPAIVTRPGDIRLLTDQEYYPVLQSVIAHATASIDVVMFVFKTTAAAKNRAAALAQDLIQARKRGVAVTVLLERSGYDHELNRENQRLGARLEKGGISVRFDSSKITTHAKVVVVDRRYSLVGSHNFTSSALSANHEVSLLVDNQSLAAELLSYMDGVR
jgi:competence ComEA-like helix-hairpin-helix protein